MNNEFLEQTIKLLKYTDLTLRLPEIYDVKMEGDKRNMHIFLEGASGGLRIKDNFVLQVIIFFGLIDAHIDSHNMELEGKHFSDKYKNLSAADDSAIMIKEIYRLLTILRNAAIHTKTAISIENNNIAVTTDKGSKLHLGVSGLELIYTFILLVLQKSSASDEYKSCLLRTYYDDIRQSIVLLQDKSGSNLTDISKGARLKRGVRYRVQNPVFMISGNSQSLLITRHVLKDPESAYADYEYILDINGTSYLIPNEVLDETGKIRLEDLNKWVLN